MRKMLVIVFFICSVIAAKSQNITVEGTAPNLYITHTVAPKENFYSIGRLYNQAPKAIASFNNLVMEKGLSIGQKVRIPMNEQNFDASGSAGTGGALIPVTHIVAKSETLFKIGADYKVSPQLIKQWNNISSDNIAPGTSLIVGHLKMTAGALGTAKPVQTESATAGVNKPTTASAPARTNTSTESSVARSGESNGTTVAVQEKPVAVAPATRAPGRQAPKTDAAIKQDDPFVSVGSTAATTTTNPVKEAAVVRTNTGGQIPAQPADEVVVKEKPTEAIEVKEDVIAVAETPKPKKEERRADLPVFETSNNVEGAFAGNFSIDAGQKTLSSKSGEAATFKSTSGWQDKKYYVLMNDVTPGTILKISSMENKVVYAKVLGNMPEMKENNGILLRISNAAASHLGIIDPKFPVKISYYQ